MDATYENQLKKLQEAAQGEIWQRLTIWAS